MNRCLLANSIWQMMSRPGARRFAHAVNHPRKVQERILHATIRRNAKTAFGAQHEFGSIRTVQDFCDRVPVRTYDAIEPWISRIAAGERGVLTREPVRRLIPTSGSSAARKLIPWTRSLQRQFNSAIGPWIDDLFDRDPEMKRGPAYWSISPAVPEKQHTENSGSSAIPIGFDEDSAYLGGLLKPLVDATFAVPGTVRHIQDAEAFQYATVLYLLRARQLRLISIWHPSFFTILLVALRDHWDGLLADLARGGCSLPGAEDEPILRAIARECRPMPARAHELAGVDPSEVSTIWPHIRMISCWTDARAVDAASTLAQRVPNVVIQPKGLLATEAFVTVPYAGERPIAICSHFFEFLDEAGRSHGAHELEQGGTYSVIVTTGGGLYRYNLGDRVEVTGRIKATPTLRFLGRDDRCSDYRGEKLTDAFVQTVIDRLFHHAPCPNFAMLAPDEREGEFGYTLYLEAHYVPLNAADRLDELLCENPHYAYSRRLGQIAPARLYRIETGANRDYLNALRHSGRQLGDIKPVALAARTGWGRVFRGTYAVAEVVTT